MEARHLPSVAWSARCVDGQDPIDLKQASHALSALVVQGVLMVGRGRCHVHHTGQRACCLLPTQLYVPAQPFLHVMATLGTTTSTAPHGAWPCG
jgi:hypothetical protein